MGFLTSDPIDVAAMLQSVAGPRCGGTAIFIGTVRDGPDDGPVSEIEYSAYEAMADAELERIVAEARTSWPEGRPAVRHRLGSIPLGEASIAVVVSAPHRAQAFDACRYIIEQVKVRVPIWKKEIFADGTMRWRENRATTPTSMRAGGTEGE